MIASRTSPALRLGFKDLFYFLNLIGLKDVSFLEIVKVLDPDTAFKSRLDFLDIILEASEGADLSVVDNYTVTKHPCSGISFHSAVEHRAACNHPHLRNMESLSYFCPAYHILFVNGLEHAEYGGPDVVDELIDDIVEANVHSFLLGQFMHLRIRSDIEADYYG